MTQSAISQQIKALEGHLGRSLFHRRPRGLELTATGASYLPIVREAFLTLSRGTRSVTASGPKVVQLHSSLSFATLWLAPRLGRFADRHPDVRLNIIAEQWEPPEGLIAGADVEIRFSVRPSENIQAEKLRQEWYFPVATPDWQGTMDDVATTRLFDCANILSTWAAWGEEVGRDWSAVPVTYGTTFAISMAAAMSGAGLGMAHDTIATQPIAEGRLKPLFEHRARMQEAYYLITAPHATQLPGAVAFANWVRDEIAAEDARRGF